MLFVGPMVGLSLGKSSPYLVVSYLAGGSWSQGVWVSLIAGERPGCPDTLGSVSTDPISCPERTLKRHVPVLFLWIQGPGSSTAKKE